MRGVPKWLRARMRSCPLRLYVELRVGRIRVKDAPKWPRARVRLHPLRPQVEFRVGHDHCEGCAEMTTGLNAVAPIEAVGGVLCGARPA